MDNGVKVHVTNQPGLSIAKIGGEARLAIEPLEIALGNLAELHPAVVILDMTDLAVISSLGMGLIVSLRSALRQHGGRLLACGMKPPVFDAFKWAKLERIFEVYGTLEAALQSVNGAQPQNV